MMEISIRKARQGNSWHRTRYAFHEAGHAVVGHVIGRCIAEVSAVSNRDEGYKGYCAFDPFMEAANNYLQWQKESCNPELLTILYAGTIAMSMVCQHCGWKYEHWRGCDKVDFDAISFLSQMMFADDEDRHAVQKECQDQARDILTKHWSAVDLLASSLLVQGRLTGGEAHQIIRLAIGEMGADWRLIAWNID